MTDTMWKCEQLRAGTVYNRVMFNTRAEAEQFAEQMGKGGARPFLEHRGGSGQGSLELNHIRANSLRQTGICAMIGASGSTRTD